jgi:hypothetical protein
MRVTLSSPIYEDHFAGTNLRDGSGTFGEERCQIFEAVGTGDKENYGHSSTFQILLMAKIRI